MLTETEKRVIASIQGDIPITQRPYAQMARRLQITEDELLQTLEQLCDRGVIRRFGATLRHQKSGYGANAMVAWRVEEHRIEAAGASMAAVKAVSHCYRRNPSEAWPYNLYTMIHAKDEASCRQIAREMASQAAVKTYTLLFSRKELKKTSMVYFPAIPNH